MGGRAERQKRPSDSNAWITEVSDDRLKAYSRLAVSEGFSGRVDGNPRTHDQQLFFSDLVQKELSRRGIGD